MKKNPVFILVFFIFNFVNAQKIYEISYWEYPKNLFNVERKTYYFIEIYNSDDKLIELQKHFPNDSNYSKTIYKYNSQNQKISETYFWGLEANGINTYFHYEENGLLKNKEYIEILKDFDTIKYKNEYFYDEFGDLIMEKDSSDRYGLINITTYNYKIENNRKIVTITKKYKNRKKCVETIQVYNEKNLLISEKIGPEVTLIKAGPKRNEYEYEYDGNGDWKKKKICFQNGWLESWHCEGEYRKIRIN